MSQFNSFFLPYQVHEESECEICGIFILESNNIASYNNNYRPRTDPPQTFKNVYASGFSLSRYHYSERTQPASHIFVSGHFRSETQVDPPHGHGHRRDILIFYFYFVSPISRRQHGGVMRLRILVEKEKVAESLSLSSLLREIDRCARQEAEKRWN